MTEDESSSSGPSPIFYDGSRYEVQLPLKEEKEGHTFLKINYQPSKKRLFSQIKRVKKDLDLLNNYSDIMREQQQAGILEKMQCQYQAKPTKYHMSWLSERIRVQQSPVLVRLHLNKVA